jgi:hypothetical protein
MKGQEAIRVSLLRVQRLLCRTPGLGRGVGLLLVAVALLGGCASFTTTVETRAPLDQRALARIIPDKTTGAEVARLLGPPHSIIRGSAHFRESGGFFYYFVSSAGGAAPNYFYSQDRQLSSLDDKHYALLYKYAQASLRVDAVLTTGGSQRSEMRFQGEELLIIIDSERDVVTDMAFRSDESPP